MSVKKRKQPSKRKTAVIPLRNPSSLPNPEAELSLSNPTLAANPQPNPSAAASSVGSTVPLPENFAAESAAILEEAGASSSPAGPADGGGISADAALPSAMFSEAAVKEWIHVPFKVLASALQDETFEIAEDWEKQCWTPGVTACLNKYIPEFLKHTDKPELVLLALAAASYLGANGRGFKLAKMLRKGKKQQHGDSLGSDMKTQDSPAA
jgi:hypothetical protein